MLPVTLALLAGPAIVASAQDVPTSPPAEQRAAQPDAGAVRNILTPDHAASTHGDQQRDRIRSSGLGLANVPTSDVQNRPTFQQEASFTQRRSSAPSVAAPSVPTAATAEQARGSAVRADTGAASLLPLLAVAVLVGAGLLSRRRDRPTV